MTTQTRQQRKEEVHKEFYAKQGRLANGTATEAEKAASTRFNVVYYTLAAVILAGLYYWVGHDLITSLWALKGI